MTTSEKCVRDHVALLAEPGLHPHRSVYAHPYRRGQFPELIPCIYRITNSNVFNRSLMQITARGMTGAVISRLKHSDEISIRCV